MINDLKKCTICGKEYPATIDYFYKRSMLPSGIRSECKICTKKYEKENSRRTSKIKKERYVLKKEECKKYNKNYYEKNKESLALAQKEWYAKNKEHKLKKDKEYVKNNKEKVYLRKQKYRKVNAEKIKTKMSNYQKNRIQNDIEFRLIHKLRARISVAIKNQYSKKALSSINLIGCSISECRSHIESQFKPGMSWDNYSYDGWHIDHIKPCASFDLTDPEEQKKCFNYKNLQPLWAVDNLRKNSIYTE